MITVIPYDSLANYDFGWLNARHHFSFGRYYDPNRMGFGALRVVNDDIIQPGEGFGKHPHNDMEIITFVRSGAITHKDNKGHEGRTEAGDIQVMSAGYGIIHSEFNHEDVPTTLFQIWITPREENLTPRWDARQFPKQPANDTLPLLVSGRPEDRAKDILMIHADAALYGGRLEAGAEVTQTLKDQGYLLVSEGSVEIDGNILKKGDAAEITKLKSVNIKALDASELILIDVAA